MQRQLPDQTGADNRRHVAQAQVQVPHAVQGDSGQGGETGLFVGYAFGHGGGQGVGDHVKLGMVGEAGPRHGDPIADPEPALQAGADGDNRAGGGIAQGQRLVEARQDGAHGSDGTVAARFGHDLLDQVGARPGLGR